MAPSSNLPSKEAAESTLIYKVYIFNRIVQESCEVLYFNIFNDLGNIGQAAVAAV
jgi:hypothetical protein